MVAAFGWSAYEKRNLSVHVDQVNFPVEFSRIESTRSSSRCLSRGQTFEAVVTVPRAAASTRARASVLSDACDKTAPPPQNRVFPSVPPRWLSATPRFFAVRWRLAPYKSFARRRRVVGTAALGTEVGARLYAKTGGNLIREPPFLWLLCVLATAVVPFVQLLPRILARQWTRAVNSASTVRSGSFRSKGNVDNRVMRFTRHQSDVVFCSRV